MGKKIQGSTFLNSKTIVIISKLIFKYCQLKYKLFVILNNSKQLIIKHENIQECKAHYSDPCCYSIIKYSKMYNKRIVKTWLVN